MSSNAVVKQPRVNEAGFAGKTVEIFKTPRQIINTEEK